jgi:dTDP-4-dehydrorhamnose reductase
MKKNILIIGYGDLGKRLTNILDNDLYNFFHVSRNNKYDSDNFIEWDWLSKKEFEINSEQIDVVIFFPKPSTYDESGYKDGFKNSAENLHKIISKFPISKFISISSTRVYNKESDPLCKETTPINPTEFRGRLIKEYEDKQIDFYSEKLIILRFSGLYDSNSKKMSKNHLHRDNAVNAIIFFIENDFYFKSYEIFNCSEDGPQGKISNQKIKDLGFNFKEYN